MAGELNWWRRVDCCARVLTRLIHNAASVVKILGLIRMPRKHDTYLCQNFITRSEISAAGVDKLLDLAYCLSWENVPCRPSLWNLLQSANTVLSPFLNTPVMSDPPKSMHMSYLISAICRSAPCVGPLLVVTSTHMYFYHHALANVKSATCSWPVFILYARTNSRRRTAMQTRNTPLRKSTAAERRTIALRMHASIGWRPYSGNVTEYW